VKKTSLMGRFFRRALLIWGATSLILTLVGGTVLLSAGLWMPIEDTPRKADAIVLLAGDPRRAPQAAKLYLRGFAPVIYVGRPVIEPDPLRDMGLPEPTEPERTQAALSSLGVPLTAIHFYGEGLRSTVDEAEHLAAELPPEARTILVVTSPSHCRRAKFIMTRALPGRELLFCPPAGQALPASWWRDQNAARQVIFECAKFLFYFTGTPFRSASASGG